MSAEFSEGKYYCQCVDCERKFNIQELPPKCPLCGSYRWNRKNKLNTETNTPTMEKKILKAAHKALKRRNLTAFFEHGQWWIEHRPSGAQWSVCDASGPSCPDGFDFEQVTQESED